MRWLQKNDCACDEKLMLKGAFIWKGRWKIQTSVKLKVSVSDWLTSLVKNKVLKWLEISVRIQRKLRRITDSSKCTEVCNNNITSLVICLIIHLLCAFKSWMETVNCKFNTIYPSIKPPRTHKATLSNPYCNFLSFCFTHTKLTHVSCSKLSFFSLLHSWKCNHCIVECLFTRPLLSSVAFAS